VSEREWVNLPAAGSRAGYRQCPALKRSNVYGVSWPQNTTWEETIQ
jgi:hypothetical protein